MRKLLIITILLSLLFICCAHNPAQNTPQSSIEGIWDTELNIPRTHQMDFSWGSSMVPFTGSIIVDLHSDPPVFQFTPDVWGPIISIIEKGNKTELTFYFARGGFNVSMICHFNDNGTMWIEPLDNWLSFIPSGTNSLYHRIE